MLDLQSADSSAAPAPSQRLRERARARSIWSVFARFSRWPWQVHATPNDADARYLSSARVGPEFCVPQTLSKSAEINHEEHEGYKEFTDVASQRLSHNCNLAVVALLSISCEQFELSL